MSFGLREQRMTAAGAKQSSNLLGYPDPPKPSRPSWSERTTSMADRSAQLDAEAAVFSRSFFRPAS